MVLYFTGTGNSEYAAKRIANEIGDRVLNLFEKIRNGDYSALHSEKPWVVVAPTYAWRIPRILADWLEKTGLSGNRNIYFVMTCGGSIGNAGKYLKPLCAKKEMMSFGCFELIMPENYIALFTTPAKPEALKIIDKAEAKIDHAASLIKAGKAFPEAKITLVGRINSGIVNDMFYPLFVHAGKFYTTDACVSCGLCEKLCPLRNIKIEDARPVWGDACTHCMACICRCPKEAIEYGRHSKGLPRYTCPK